jgi:hypothetical protein
MLEASLIPSSASATVMIDPARTRTIVLDAITAT